MRITKKRAAIAGVSALALAGAGAFVAITGADAATGTKPCSPHGGVTGTPTTICAPVPSSPTAFRWRQIVAAPGPAGPAGQAGPAGAPGKDGANGKDGAPGQAGKDGKDGVSGIQSDGPYPGATQVTGGNSDKPFKGDKGATLQTAWVRCDTGKVATGGGFTVQGGADDNGSETAKDIQIVGSFPFSLDKDGKFVDTSLNAQGSLKPNAWVVKGFNNGTSDLTVRPFVVCVTAS